jgi:hypothetical protein
MTRKKACESFTRYIAQIHRLTNNNEQHFAKDTPGEAQRRLDLALKAYLIRLRDPVLSHARLLDPPRRAI